MIQLEALTLGYGQQILLDHVSANLNGGGLIALLGRNGSGKSTLLRATAGLGTIKSGRILLAGKDLAELRPEEVARTVSFVTTEKVRIPNLKCRDVVALGRAPYTNWVGRLQPRDREIVAKSLALLDMSAYAERTMDQMSDGECILFSTHELDIALTLCDSIALIDHPHLHYLPTRQMINSGHIERLFRNETITFDPKELRIRIR